MTVHLARVRLWLRPAAAAAILLAGLTGCTGAAARDGADAARPDRSATATAEGPGPSDRPDPALAGEPVPTLPPGDPGVGDDGEPGAGVGDDGEPGAGGHADEEGEHDGEITGVPTAAFVDADTVAALTGSTWSPAPDPRGCTSAAPPGAAAARSATLSGTDGRLVQVIGAYETVRASNAAVAMAAAALGRCGFRETGDPRLGTASAELARPAGDGISAGDGDERAMVLAAEGVTVILVATGSPAAAGAWESLADVALGTSCAAAAHGCH